ncbi:MAG: serpin family protein [Leptolyngbyaceae cyanobacterium]
MIQPNQSRSRFSKIAIASLLLLGLMGCLATNQGANAERARPSSPPSLAQESVAQTTDRVNSDLIAANTQFGLRLFAQLNRQSPSKNIVLSPTSVAIALGMTYNGANGATQQAMAATLGVQGFSLEALNQANRDLLASLKQPEPTVQLAIANSLWANQQIPLKPDFLQRNQDYYGAKVTNLNFADSKAPAIINQWVSQQTQGKIPTIVDQVRPDDVLFLINAIYFKGDWSTPFDPKLTKNQPFFLDNGRQISHAAMTRAGEFRYFETDQFQAVSLPYGKEGRMSFNLFLPKKTTALADFVKTLTPENWQTWMGQFRTIPGRIQIPRFKLEYETELNSDLKMLGMGVAFSDQADFSKLSTATTQISEVKHKTFIEVNEAGTEAAAATSVGIRLTAAPIGEPFQLVVDRPFFFAIRDNKTGTVLFMGNIQNPS